MGRKSRPTCVVVAVRSAKDGLTHLALLAVTTQPPQLDRAAMKFRIRSTPSRLERPEALLG